MHNPAFLVEGQMEQAIVQRICPGQPVRRIGCNGDSVPIERICDFIETQVRLLGNRHFPIIIIFDREKRVQSCAEISTLADLELRRRGLADQDIRIFVADREFEDWYLHDIDSICSHYSIQRPSYPVTGKSGLSKLISDKERYHERTTGVELFFIVSIEKIADRCGIFSSLIESALEIGCEYFKYLEIQKQLDV